ncbi:hypothetical protein FIU97_13975 [Roseivivax sp. THAF40]|uniref:hypothetical protein n=1 Tax=unclassified Roseivivax TaxID=2639302 RepID=UPI0012685B45|nr:MULTISPECIES: hypothetical protein [unclassified Roseivivax]QFS83852.1 hypothetical protein FIV09_13535 [Roseivivax sp. THAF197b]QFT47684.1 hypothetical protein FIU97_13975 [Roseivivax sp. THAF40]
MKYLTLATLCLGLAGPALAQSGGDECGLQADIVMRVVEARQDGAEANAALNTVAGSLSGEAEKYMQVVPAIAEWVYSLPADQLGAEVGESWRAQCAKM